ncbi:hypothetical protein FN976_11010 [Caenimonas sedimenti]|uniref:Uncharacterized protein n=1 Tax=Caenimonas sedimenti TaxID=2596921 RepID=A0A562ZS68_9BURK|nr:hypothetical protein [Caenimonas sedimenti]TWO71439.1 hypothetical protein FN976_11010 [Caenimonas sedimenti]
MNPTDPPTYTNVLEQAVQLGAGERRRLAKILAREGDESQTPESAEDIADWLVRIEREEPRVRLALIDDALDHVEPESVDQETLLSARGALLDRHPPLAVRRSVTDLASAHPVATSMGLVGLVLALVGVGRSVIERLF